MRSVVSSPWVGRLVVASLLALPLTARGQTPPPPTPTPRPAPTPSPRARATGAGSTVIVKVTDSFGAPLAGIRVTASGPVARSGSTDATGDVRFAAVRAGTYRLRFEGEKVITFEREITVSGAQPPAFEVSLSPAPPPPPPPPAPKPEPAPVARASDAPPPEPKTLSILDLWERNTITSREPSKTTSVACGATSTTSLLQVREPLKNQVHDGADELIYVVAGTGTLTLNTPGASDVPLQAATFSVIPRGVSHSFQQRGRNPLVIVATLTDTPCQGK